MVIRRSKMSKKILDVDDIPIDANISVSSKRKYRNIQRHRHESNEAGNLKEKQQRFKADLFDKLADADDDYVQCWTGMMSICTDDNCESVNDNAVDNDPQYEIFLGSLKEDGKSYVLEVSEKIGLLEPLKYEAEDESDNELDQDTQSQMNNTIEGNVGDDRSNSSRGSKLEDQKAFSSLHENQRKESAVENVTWSDSMNCNPFGDCQFLVEEHTIEGISGSQCKIGMQDGYGERHKSESLRNKRWKLDSAVNIEKKKDDDFDYEYQCWCNNISYGDNNVVFKYKDAPAIVYEGDSRTDNITHSTKGDPRPVQADATVEEDDSCQCLGSPIRESCSLFREQVMRILRKPYDEKEHQMLLENILARKPIERNIDLRFGREQLYTVNKKGKSYLDHYYDLRRKLEAAKTSREKLILLRGFFFWLQNLTQEGAFKPWLDASCLALLPQSR